MKTLFACKTLLIIIPLLMISTPLLGMDFELSGQATGGAAIGREGFGGRDAVGYELLLAQQVPRRIAHDGQFAEDDQPGACHGSAGDELLRTGHVAGHVADHRIELCQSDLHAG